MKTSRENLLSILTKGGTLSQDQADDVSARYTEEVAFVDAGENFEAVFCPLCNKELDQDWWGEAMEHASLTEFTDLTVRAPCCQGSTNLNDLRYEMPQGFSRFVLEVLNPNVAAVPDAVVAELQKLLGCEIQVVWAQY